MINFTNVEDQTKTTVTKLRSYRSRAGKKVTGTVTYPKHISPTTSAVKRYFNKVKKLHESLGTMYRENGMMLWDEFTPIVKHNVELFNDKNKKALL